MTPVIDFDRDELVVRDLLEPFARVQPVRLKRHPNRQRERRFRPALAVAAGAALLLVGAGVAAATGVLPGWKTEQALIQSPFMTATDPAALPGSTVNLSAPGPASSTVELVSNDTETVGTLQEHCTAVVATDAEGRPLGDFPSLRGCGVAHQISPQGSSSGAARIEWTLPSGVTYAVIYGAGAAPRAVKVALVASNGDAVSTGPAERGYFLLFTPLEQATGTLVLYDQQGQVVDKLDSPQR
jgi:hypothetical protein